MNDKERYYDYLKHMKQWHYTTGILDAPILILLWYLNYQKGFWTLLVLFILNEFIAAHYFKKIEKRVGLIY